MSTEFYPFKGTISSVRLECGPGHDTIGVWQAGAKCGELTVTKGAGKDLVFLFASDVAAFNVVNTGLASVTVHVFPYGVGMLPDQFVISEYGELMRVKDVLKLGHVEKVDS